MPKPIGPINISEVWGKKIGNDQELINSVNVHLRVVLVKQNCKKYLEGNTAV